MSSNRLTTERQLQRGELWHRLGNPWGVESYRELKFHFWNEVRRPFVEQAGWTVARELNEQFEGNRAGGLNTYQDLMDQVNVKENTNE